MAILPIRAEKQERDDRTRLMVPFGRLFLFLFRPFSLTYGGCCPAFAEAPACRTRLWQAGLRAGRSKIFHPTASPLLFGVGFYRRGTFSERPPNLPLPVFDRKKIPKGRNYPSLAKRGGGDFLMTILIQF